MTRPAYMTATRSAVSAITPMSCVTSITAVPCSRVISFSSSMICAFFFQAEDGIRDADVIGVQTCALPILMQKIAETGSIKEQGGIIVLEMSDTDYSLAHISQVVESENAKVLSSFITSNANSKVLELT